MYIRYCWLCIQVLGLRPVYAFFKLNTSGFRQEEECSSCLSMGCHKRLRFHGPCAHYRFKIDTDLLLIWEFFYRFISTLCFTFTVVTELKNLSLKHCRDKSSTNIAAIIALRSKVKLSIVSPNYAFNHYFVQQQPFEGGKI